jgi:hypothetical protein
MRKLLCILVLMMMLAAAAHADCTVVGSISIWEGQTASIRIYAENRQGGNGELKFDGQMSRGQRVSIAGTERIRYEYKHPGDTQFHSNTGASCIRNEDVSIP